MTLTLSATTALLTLGLLDAIPGVDPRSASAAPAKLDTTKIQIELDKAIQIKIPTPTEDLKPVAFKTSDGREGWAIRIPGIVRSPPPPTSMGSSM